MTPEARYAATLAVQHALATAGLYHGALDGDPGPLTRAAVNALFAPVSSLPASQSPSPAAFVSPAVLATLQHNDWPLEAAAAAFFGYPPNLTQIELPYAMEFEGRRVERLTCNMKVAASLRRIFHAIQLHYEGDLARMAADGLLAFDGCYNDRSIRGSTHRSMHAYGAAIDLDAEHNPLGATKGRMPRAVVEIFTAESWRWGGDYQGRKDWMHFEACR